MGVENKIADCRSRKIELVDCGTIKIKEVENMKGTLPRLDTTGLSNNKIFSQNHRISTQFLINQTFQNCNTFYNITFFWVFTKLKD